MAGEWVVWNRHVLDPGTGQHRSRMGPSSWESRNGKWGGREARPSGCGRSAGASYTDGACKWVGGASWWPAERRTSETSAKDPRMGNIRIDGVILPVKRGRGRGLGPEVEVRCGVRAPRWDDGLFADCGYTVDLAWIGRQSTVSKPCARTLSGPLPAV